MIANEMPPQMLFPWRKDLEDIGAWLRTIEPWQPDPMHAALAMVLHVKEVINKQRLDTYSKVDILDVLVQVKEIIGATRPALTEDSFEKALKRTSPTDRETAQRLLRSWQLLLALQ
jgi:hypothetical protein